MPSEYLTNHANACRYLYAENSREPLKLSRKMLVRILSYHQVMPSYIDFLCVFGSQDEPRDLRFASFREQTLISEPARGPAVEALGRSGRQFQICYNLKAANCTSSANTKVQAKQWSIRQVAIHHQFDVKTGTTLWIVTKGDKEIKNRIEDLTGPDGRPEDTDFSTPEECFKRTLGAHMVYCHWSAEDWRAYVQWLEEYIDRGASDPLYRSICALANQQQQTAMVFAPRDGNFPCYKFEPKHVQDVHSLEEKVNIAVLLLEANVNIIKLLKEFYERLVVDKNFPWKESCKDHVIAFSDQLIVMVYDLETEISRAKLLNRIIGERKALVSICINASIKLCTNRLIGIAAHSSPKYRKNGTVDLQHGRTGNHGAKRGHRNANNHGGDGDLSASNVCLCEQSIKFFSIMMLMTL